MRYLAALIAWLLAALAAGADWIDRTPHVVRVLAGANLGTGSVVCADPTTREAWILTCKHVTAGSTTATITWPDGYTARGTLAGTGRRTDTALLHATAATAAFIPIATEPALRGTPVIALGYGGQSGPVDSLQLVSWRTTIRGYKQPDDRIQLDPGAQSGDSGGPVLDEAGRLVGIVEGGQLAYEGGPALDSHGAYQGQILNLLKTYVPAAVYQRCYPSEYGPCEQGTGPQPGGAQIIQSPPRQIVQIPPTRRSPVQKPDPTPELPPLAQPDPCAAALAELVKAQNDLNAQIQAALAKEPTPGPPGPPGPTGPPGATGAAGPAAKTPDMAAILAAIKQDPQIAATITSAAEPIDYQAIADRIAPLLPPIRFRRLRADPNGPIEQDGMRFTEQGVESIRLGGELTFRGFPRSN